jgi:hypothetical protein
MSIVAVHGPNTFGASGAGGAGTGRVIQNAQIKVTADMANGQKFYVEAVDKTRPAADYDWTFTGGSPATKVDDKGTTPIAVTYSSGGTKTIQLVIAAGAGPPAGGTYTINVVATATAAPRSVQEEGEEDVGMVFSPEPGGEFDPSEHTVAEVQAYIEAHPEEVGDILAAEQEGKNRATLVTWLEETLPFDPADHTVTEVIGFAEENPDEIDNLIEAEQAGKNRSTLIAQLEGLKSEEDS